MTFSLIVLMALKHLKQGNQTNTIIASRSIKAISQWKKLEYFPKENNPNRQKMEPRYPSHFPQMPNLHVLS